MKKRIGILFILLFLIVSMTGCGISESKATIIDKNGKSIELSLKELRDKIKGNTSSFNDNYLAGKITLTDKIKSINDATSFRAGTYSCGTYLTKYYNKLVEIEFENDWITLFVFKDNDNVDISNLSVGDTITVSTNISSITSNDDNVYLYLNSYDGGHCEFGTTPTVVTKE